MALEKIINDADERMKKALEILRQEFHTIRTGRASAALVENLRVDYYGAATPLKQLATISTVESNLLVIRPFDPASTKEIEKAILKSNLGITPAANGKGIRLVFPPLSEERRNQLAHQVKSLGEQAKIAIRNVRKDANKHIEAEEESGVSEDDAFRAREDVQELTKDYENKVDQLVKEKTKQIMEV